jgi:hypothetical protein
MILTASEALPPVKEFAPPVPREAVVKFGRVIPATLVADVPTENRNPLPVTLKALIAPVEIVGSISIMAVMSGVLKRKVDPSPVKD